MRTALAALVLLLVVLGAVVGASYLAGYFRLEFDTADRDAPAAPQTDDGPAVASEPAADLPPEEPIAPPPPPRIETGTIEAAEPVSQPDSVATSEPASAEAVEPSAEPTVGDSTATEPESETDPSTVASAPRLVGGAGITPAPVSHEELPREAVPAKPPKPPEPPRWRTFRHVMVLEAGLIDLGKRSVELAGAEPAPRDRDCRLSEGASSLPCAQLALQAMRQRIRALGVQCEISADETADPVVAPCRLGRTDLALWLIAQGWATAREGAPAGYGAAEKQARCAQLGMWLETEPPGDCPAR